MGIALGAAEDNSLFGTGNCPRRRRGDDLSGRTGPEVVGSGIFPRRLLPFLVRGGGTVVARINIKRLRALLDGVVLLEEALGTRWVDD